jgi:hypothetical protein
MTQVDYFKLQAKNLFKDFKKKAQKRFPDDAEYIVTHEFGYDEEGFSLMKAQHIIALMSGFEKWADLAKAPDDQLKVAKLLFDYRDSVNVEEWQDYVFGIETNNDVKLDSEVQFQILSQVWLGLPPEEGHPDIREPQAEDQHPAKTKTPQRKQAPNGQITALPLNPMDRADFIEVANEAFEDVMERIEPDSPDLTRELWDVEDYVDTMLTPDMLPINKGHALSLVEDFLVHHVIDLATQADRTAAKA